ncbi:MAG: ABC transporter substrate-binding protein [Lachnospiraceae bacterium]|nr:ABC transporter substrate-binding protein [Lachnospiraceae bacterium]
MKKRVKRLAAILLVSILVFSLAACGSANETEQTTESSADAGNDTEDSSDSSAEDTQSESADVAEEGVDPITGEKYPDQINIGTLNGAIQTGIAEEEGFFEELGIKVNILYFDSGRDVSNAFASNSIDVASFGSSPISLGVSNDLGYEVIFINDVIGKSESLAAKQDSGISTIADLKGKKVATPFASTAHFSLLNALLLEGVEEGEVELLDMQPQDILAAWQRGDIDAAYVWNPVLAELLKDGVVLTDSEKLAEQGAVTADLTTANKEFAQKYPTLVTAYTEVFIKTYDLIQNDYEKAAEDTAKNLNITVEEAKEQLEGVKWISGEDQLLPEYLGTSGEVGALADTIKATADFHVTQGNLDSAPELDVFKDAVDPSFVEAALGK